MIKFTLNRPGLQSSKKDKVSPNNRLYFSGLINTTQVAEQIALNHYPTYSHLPSHNGQSIHQQSNHIHITFNKQGRNHKEIVRDHNKNKPHHKKVTFHHHTAGKGTNSLLLKNYQDSSRTSGNSKIVFNYSSPISNIQTQTFENRNLFFDISQKTYKQKYRNTTRDIGVSQKLYKTMKDSPETSTFSSSEIIPIPQVHSTLNLSQQMQDLFKDDHNEEKQIHQAFTAVKQLEQLFQE